MGGDSDADSEESEKPDRPSLDGNIITNSDDPEERADFDGDE
ncbi:hypothetical protein SAMN05216559_2302 [Halomicrobium zhouii]|uniref:Uncharacterized protein n=1 Tax=Halomicrobium zhouii TaxID=767519 RepID=A0A1I6L9C3_9EURY|nr:hypothetical protein SAMN05216559_2302 [Halomicrobium zhouii]